MRDEWDIPQQDSWVKTQLTSDGKPVSIERGDGFTVDAAPSTIGKVYGVDVGMEGYEVWYEVVWSGHRDDGELIDRFGARLDGR